MTAGGAAPRPGREALRRNAFLFQDGLVLSVTLRGLDAVGILGPALARERTLVELRPDLSESGFGYLRVALRCLASQGWLESGPGFTLAETSLRFTEIDRAGARAPRALPRRRRAPGLLRPPRRYDLVASLARRPCGRPA